MSSDPISPPRRIAFLGFGEAGQAFASGLAGQNPGLSFSAYDIDALKNPAIESGGAEILPSPEAISGDLIFSVVTAEAALEAAESLGRADLSGALYLDCNSCAPGTKRRAAEVIERAGGRYVDTAVMAPVHPALHATPLLISGPHAEAALDAIAPLGMKATLAPGPVGTASTRKMIRSVMIKGIEALCLECLLAARKAGVEDEVLTSLARTYPGIDWPVQGAYNLERAATHGIRRAAEMREVAKTIAELGLPNDMASATALWQERTGGRGTCPEDADLATRADALLTALNATASR